MTVLGSIALAALAGLNPWVVLLITLGLASFTRHAPLGGPLAALGGPVALAVVGLVLGVEVVASKVRRTASAIAWLNRVAAAAAGALLVASLAVDGAPPPPWLFVAGALAASAVRFARHAFSHRLDRLLRPFGYIATGIASDVLAGTLAAAVFAIKP